LKFKEAVEISSVAGLGARTEKLIATIWVGEPGAVTATLALYIPGARELGFAFTTKLPVSTPDAGATDNHAADPGFCKAADQFRVPSPALLTATGAVITFPIPATPDRATKFVETLTAGTLGSGTVYVTVTVWGELIAE